MPHPLAPDLRLDDFNATFLTDHAPVFHPLIAATETFIILDGTEYFRTEKTVTFGLERSIIDCLRLFNLTVRPGKNLVRRGNGYFYCIKSNRIFWFFKIAENIFHSFYSRLYIA